MTAVPLDAVALRARRRYLAGIAGKPWPATVFLLLDTIAAIGFAGGLAGAVAALTGSAAAALPWLALMLASGAARGACAYLSARAGAGAAATAKQTLRARIVGAVLHRAPSGAPLGTLIGATVDEVEAIDGHVARFLPARQAAVWGPLLVLAAVAIASPVSAGILLFTLIPFIAAMVLAGGAAAAETRRQFGAMARLSGLFVDRIRALPVILAFRAEDREAARIGAASDEVAKRTLGVLAIAFLSSGALEFFAALSVALVAVYAGFNLLGELPFPVPEKLDLARAFFVLALAPEFYAPMRRLAAAYHDRQQAEGAAERLEPIEQSQAAQPAAPAIHLDRPPAIAFRNVTIRYPGTDRPTLEGFSLEVPAGGSVALLGPSGSGKSSLLHLLLGLTPLSGGTILIDGVPLPPGTVLNVGWASQTPLIMPGTIRDNIALARPDATGQHILAAAGEAGLAGLLSRRPQALDERGGGLSGGERRRIGLARALLRDAPLLLLDEPTAHLDAASERALIDAIVRSARGRTTLIATHSETLAAIADRTVRLEMPA